MDLNLGLTIGGLVLTVVTFYFGYRKTIGGQAERARSVNDAIATQLARHFSLSEEELDLDEVISIRAGKAIAAGVRSSSVLKVSDFRQLVLSKVFENEYLNDPQKRIAINRVKSTFDSKDSGINDRAVASIAARRRRMLFVSSALIAVFSVGSSLLALLVYVSTFPDQNIQDSLKNDLWMPAVATSAAGILLAIFTDLQRRFGRSIAYNLPEEDEEQLEETSQRQLISKLSDLGSFESISGADYLFKTNSGKKILLEIKNVKNWKKWRFVSPTVSRLEKISRDINSDLVAIIVPSEVFMSNDLPILPRGVEFFTIGSLRARAIALNNSR